MIEMRHEILDKPDFAMLRMVFDAPGERLVAEAGAMVSMSSGIDISTNMRGGLLSAAKRRLLGGESLFQNTFTATRPGQEVLLAPPPEGDIAHKVLEAGEVFFLQSGAYIAHAGPQMQLDTKWGGIKSFFGGVGLFLIKMTGPGEVFFSGYGALREHHMTPPETMVCDTGHIVGFSGGLEYDVKSFGGFKGLFFSGEGLVCHFRGNGTLCLQTRNPSSLASFLEPYRPQKSRSNN